MVREARTARNPHPRARSLWLDEVVGDSCEIETVAKAGATAAALSSEPRSS
jgi:hypothetical protein